MKTQLVRGIAIMLLVASSACASIANAPATTPSTDVNPITGSRGGSGSAN